MKNLTKLPAWKQAVEDFREARFKYGDEIKDEWFWEHLGVEKPSAKTLFGAAERSRLMFVSGMTDLREALSDEFRMELESIPGGFRVVLPQEQTEWAEREAKRQILKASRMLRRRLVNTDRALLTFEQQRQNADALARQSMLAQMIRRKRPEIAPTPDSKQIKG